MKIAASAPGKAILFGEHAVVYGKPAIAVAVNKKAHIKIRERSDSLIKVEAPGLGVSGYLELEDEAIKYENNPIHKGILNYLIRSLKKIQNTTGSYLDFRGLNITIDLEIPVGAGLGSSAAVTVATLAAASSYHELDLKRDEIASLAHQVELDVQGAASPIDTTLSTYGGAIYLSEDAGRIEDLAVDWNIPLVIGHTPRRGNTKELIKYVRIKKEKYPSIINPIIESIHQITEKARKTLLDGDEETLGELMNINHGLLDALGVNTPALSRMIYLARESGAKGSKITGAGGGGSIIAYCPGRKDEVLHKLKKVENAFAIKISREGFKVTV